jgi:hypothetical protein
MSKVFFGVDMEVINKGAPQTRVRPSRAKKPAAPAPAPEAQTTTKSSRSKKAETTTTNTQQGPNVEEIVKALRDGIKQPKYNSKLAIGLAYVLVGSGTIATIVFLSPVPILELLNVGLYIILPILGLMFCLGLISLGTAKMIWNMGLRDEVEARYLQMKAEIASA